MGVDLNGKGNWDKHNYHFGCNKLEWGALCILFKGIYPPFEKYIETTPHNFTIEGKDFHGLKNALTLMVYSYPVEECDKEEWDRLYGIEGYELSVDEWKRMYGKPYGDFETFCLNLYHKDEDWGYDETDGEHAQIFLNFMSFIRHCVNGFTCS